MLVEGASDRAAVEALARRRGRDLRSEGVEVIAVGGASAIPAVLDVLGPRGHDVRLAGLCDAAEAAEVARGLARAGLGSGMDRTGMAAVGFHVCDADLEDELIRSLGVPRVLAVVEQQGELASLHRFQRQPAQRGRPVVAQLRRFLGTRSGRKARYGRALVDALDLAAVPDPLDAVLASVGPVRPG